MLFPDPFRNFGVSVHHNGAEVRVYSATATGIQLCVFDSVESIEPRTRVELAKDSHDVWSARTTALTAGSVYSFRASGPQGPNHRFDPALDLLDPYARGVQCSAAGVWRSVVADERFDFTGVSKPRRPATETVLYEVHVKGFSKLNSAVPEELRGTYAGLAHPASVGYLTELGVTTIELLPVHQSVPEQRLLRHGLTNYWGYNTLNFFSPHASYATKRAQADGASAVLVEFKEMVRDLHAAGIEVVLDVVFNHTAEEGPEGPTTSLRGLDNASYYRQSADGEYIDVTGCGNTVNFALPAAQRLVLDSLRYWANDVQVDGFRFDLATTLGRNGDVEFTPEHPLLQAILADPELQGTKLIAEPWDVGMGGWQVGNFPLGFQEWNDRYRDTVRDFWLTDIAAARHHGDAGSGIGALAGRIAGSADVFSEERGPVASVNFVTAHDGFTLADLTAFNEKHNIGNGEDNRDGSTHNRSFNHGVEGPTATPSVHAARRKAMRNLLGTLLLSAGTPMLVAGDEFGRSQHGNNNAYCHDSPLTWLSWEGREHWQNELLHVTQLLLRLRRENPALRPAHFARTEESVPTATSMDWFNADGVAMGEDDWNSPAARTLQYFATTDPNAAEVNRVLLVVHGREEATTVTLPHHAGVTGYTLLWDSATDSMPHNPVVAPGASHPVAGASMQLFRAE